MSALIPCGVQFLKASDNLWHDVVDGNGNPAVFPSIAAGQDKVALLVNTTSDNDRVAWRLIDPNTGLRLVLPGS